jgi:hypothetical protein
MIEETKLECPICNQAMVSEDAIGMSYSIDGPHGIWSREYFAVLYSCPAGCCMAEDWHYDDGSDFHEDAVRNNQTYWYKPNESDPFKRDDENILSVPGEE